MSKDNTEILAEYIFWLPMNKDIFGFTNIKQAPLNTFSIINKHFTNEKSLYEILEEKKLNPKIENNNKNRVVNIKVATNSKLSIYSNGLYKIEFTKEVTEKELFETINKIFDFEYIDSEKKIYKDNTSKINKKKMINLKEYKGILTYSQIEILLNGLFDENISPSYYFNYDEFKEIKEIKKKLSLKNIFNSIILKKDGKDYIPIGSSRKTYTDNEELFSLAMEQFIRVTNTFSLEHYKRGLDFCLKQLSRLGTMRSFNQNETTKNFIPPSLSRLDSSISSLESYQTMIFEKLPIIEYLYELANGLSNAANNEEKIYGLKEALRQYKRRLYLINRYFKNVEDSISIENQKNIQYELSEIRKYNEINSEMFVNDQLNFQQDINTKEQAKVNKLMYFVTIMAVLFTIISPILSYIFEKKDNHITNIYEKIQFIDTITIFGFILIFFLVGYFTINKNILGYTLKLKKYKFLPIPLPVKYEPNLDNNEIYSRHIFENTNPNNVLEKNNQRFNKYIEILSNKFENITKIPSLKNPNNMIKCIKFDSFQEKFPTFKLYKFSFYSEEENYIKYILHIDIEFDFHRKITNITDIRLVVLRNQKSTFDLEKIHDHARDIKIMFYDLISNANKALDDE